MKKRVFELYHYFMAGNLKVNLQSNWLELVCKDAVACLWVQDQDFAWRILDVPLIRIGRFGVLPSVTQSLTNLIGCVEREEQMYIQR